MGYTHYFHTDNDNPKPMTLNEVMAGVKAIKEVAERRCNEFRIDFSTETAILITPRSENPVEGFCFQPTRTKRGFVQKFGFCKTNLCSEDEGIKEILNALQKAVNNKLCISSH